MLNLLFVFPHIFTIRLILEWSLMVFAKMLTSGPGAHLENAKYLCTLI